VTSSLADYLSSDWPGIQQVFRLTRERKTKKGDEIEVIFGITSQPHERAGAKKLLAQVRDHWGIENGLHYVRDVTLGEDASRIRTKAAPQVMAILRNIVVFVCERFKHKSVAAATRHYVCHPEKAVKILSNPI
jgi:predicted transposase YbfD/YdcC